MLTGCHAAAPIVIARGLSPPVSTTEIPTATPASVSSNITEMPTASDANTAGHEIGESRARSGAEEISTAMMSSSRVIAVNGFERSQLELMGRASPLGPAAFFHRVTEAGPGWCTRQK